MTKMCEGVVIEGHLLIELRKELRNGQGALYDIVVWLETNCGIAMTDLIQTHWVDKGLMKDQYFHTWYVEKVNAKVIRWATEKNLNKHQWKKIHNEYGLPKDLYDRGYIKCAHGTAKPKYILSEEIPLHDPKVINPPKKLVVIQQHSGALCKYLEDQLGIQVGNREHFKARFAICKGICQQKANAGSNCL